MNMRMCACELNGTRRPYNNHTLQTFVCSVQNNVLTSP